MKKFNKKIILSRSSVFAARPRAGARPYTGRGGPKYRVIQSGNAYYGFGLFRAFLVILVVFTERPHTQTFLDAP